MASPGDNSINSFSMSLLGAEQLLDDDLPLETRSSFTKEEARPSTEPDSTNLHDLLESLKIPDGVKEILSVQEQPVNFVLVGKYQVGKSALINSMFYKKAKGYQLIAEEGDLEPTTEVIKYYPREVDGIMYHIYDTMGLQDGTNKEKAHVKEIKDIFAKAHLIIYCTKFQEPVRPDDVSTLKALTNACGKSIWNNAVIALTFANAAAPNNPKNKNWFDELLQKKKEKLKKCFVEDLGIGEEVWVTLSQHTVPVGNTIRPDLPGIKDWRASFWRECVHACSDKAKGAMAGLAWKEESFVKSVSVASVGSVAAAGGIALTVVGAASSATVIALPVGIPVAIAGLVALVGGTAAAIVTKRKASQSSDN